MCQDGSITAVTVNVPRRVVLLAVNEAESVTCAVSPPSGPPVIWLKRLLNCFGPSDSRPGGAWATAAHALITNRSALKARARCPCHPEIETMLFVAILNLSR